MTEIIKLYNQEKIEMLLEQFGTHGKLNGVELLQQQEEIYPINLEYLKEPYKQLGLI